MITGITVNYNTPQLLERAYNSVRRWHNFPIIIIDGSDNTESKKLQAENTTVVFTGHNIGHGRGLDMGLRLCKTPYALIFDSDIEMLRTPVKNMMKYMNENVYGVGWITHIGDDGFDYGTPGRNHMNKIPYLHPYFALINVDNYSRFEPFVHHGAPAYKAMKHLYNEGFSDMLIQHPYITGHTSGEGWNWTGKPNKYVKHNFGGTRSCNKLRGFYEITGKWEL